MGDQNKPPLDEVKTTCEVCMKEIPLSEAHSDEASDYVRHFCGLDCYDKWRHQPQDEDAKQG